MKTPNSISATDSEHAEHKVNKFVEEETVMNIDKAAKRPPSINGIPKQNNSQ